MLAPDFVCKFEKITTFCFYPVRDEMGHYLLFSAIRAMELFPK